MRSAGIARPVGERTPGTGGAGLSGPAVRRGGGALGAEPATRFGDGARGLAADASAHVPRGDGAVPGTARFRRCRVPPARPAQPAVSAGRAHLSAPGHESVSGSPPGDQGDRGRGAARDRAARAARPVQGPGARELARGRDGDAGARGRDAGAAAVQRAGGRQPPRVVGRSHGGGYAGGRWPLHLAGDAAEPRGGRAARASSGARRQATATGYAALAANTSAPAGADRDGAGLPVARGGARRRSRRRRAPVAPRAGQGCDRRALRGRCGGGRLRTGRLLRAEASPTRRQRARERIAARYLEAKGRRGQGGERRPAAHDAAGRPRRTRDRRGARIAMRIVGLIGILALAAPALVISQGRPTLAFRGDAGFVWVRSDTAPAGAAGAIRLRGPVLGGEGRLVFNGFSVGLGLSSGTLKAADQGTAKRDLIEGRLLVAARPLPWLEMSVGPFVRAYVTDAVTERWVFWQARARVDAPIVTSGLTSYLELWRAVSSQVNLVAGAGRVQGGEAGVTYRPPKRPFSLRLAYRVDDAAVRGGGGGSEELGGVSVARSG